MKLEWEARQRGRVLDAQSTVGEYSCVNWPENDAGEQWTLTLTNERDPVEHLGSASELWRVLRLAQADFDARCAKLIPPDQVVVPKEATEGMVDAGRRALENNGLGQIEDSDAICVYAAMIKRAQEDKA